MEDILFKNRPTTEPTQPAGGNFVLPETNLQSESQERFRVLEATERLKKEKVAKSAFKHQRGPEYEDEDVYFGSDTSQRSMVYSEFDYDELYARLGRLKGRLLTEEEKRRVRKELHVVLTLKIRRKDLEKGNITNFIMAKVQVGSQNTVNLLGHDVTVPLKKEKMEQWEQMGAYGKVGTSGQVTSEEADIYTGGLGIIPDTTDDYYGYGQTIYKTAGGPAKNTPQTVPNYNGQHAYQAVGGRAGSIPQTDPNYDYYGVGNTTNYEKNIGGPARSGYQYRKPVSRPMYY